MSHLLVQDIQFEWMHACQTAFDTLKEMLILAPIMQPLNLPLPFKMIYDATDYVIGVVLGQRRDGKPYVVYDTTKTLNNG